MFYEQFIRLIQLKPTKWYSFITKYKNAKILVNTINEVEKGLNKQWKEDIVGAVLEFAQSVHAMNSIINGAVSGVFVYGLDETINKKYGCGNKIISMRFNNIVGFRSVEVKVYRETNILDVSYRLTTNTSGVDRLYRFVYRPDVGMKSLTNVDKVVLKSIREEMLTYIFVVSNFLRNKYT